MSARCKGRWRPRWGQAPASLIVPRLPFSFDCNVRATLILNNLDDEQLKSLGSSCSMSWLR
jgi:hypothetical protein